MTLKLGGDHAKMWKEFFNIYFIVITSILLYLMLLVTSEPVCYTRVSLDERNEYMKRVDCDGTDKICHRFASSEDVQLGVLLNSPCEYPEDYPSTHENLYKEITCSTNNLPKVPEGSFDCALSSNIKTGGACTLTCNEGFYPAYSSRAVCEEDITNQGGVWSGGSFVCHGITCTTNNLPTVLQGSFDCVPNTNISKGEVCILTCNEGFYPAYSSRAVCEEDITNQGVWSNGSFVCHEITCSTNNLPIVGEGSFDCAPNTNISKGEACALICNEGFYPANSSQAVCEEDITNQGGVWSDGSFVCHEITCSTNNLPIVGEGSFDCAPNTNISKGEACALICNEGFYPANSSQAVCEEDITNQGGVWSDGSFVCHEITCSTNNLPTVVEGSFDCAPNTNISKGEACTLTCNEGFYPANSSRAVCEEEMTNQGGVWSGGSFVCHAITCQEVHLPTTNAGFFNCSGFSIGDKCNLTCNDNYYPSATKFTVCEEYDDHKANWTVGKFQCSECNEWNEWNGSEYKLTSTRRSWEDSRQLCENDNSQLVTIGNREENEFVSKLVWHCHQYNVAWIGLNDRNTEGTWEWSDGTVSAYRIWHEGEPDGGDTKDCVFMNRDHREWHDGPCAHQDNAICERNNTLT